MTRGSNYLTQAAQAKLRFLTYDQQRLIEKLGVQADEMYIYVNLLRQQHRLNRHTGDLQREWDGGWVDANSYEEVMTLLDLVCDSQQDRFLSGKWKSMGNFGLQFHQKLLEQKRDPVAEAFERDPAGLRRACMALGGRRIPGCDIGYAMELFDGLEIGLQFWYGDEEFYPRLRYLWDENALQYIRYETMYFAVNLLLRRLREWMDSCGKRDCCKM